MFNNARLKLTAWYLLIIMVISISFSAVIFRTSANEVERFDRIQRARIQIGLGFAPPTYQEPSLIQETENRIVTALVIINATVLIVSGITGYILAGMTLAPIQEMVDEQNRFISDASHEISTPLTSLKTAMEVYLREKKPTLEEAKILTRESIDEVNKLQSLAESLLQLAQFEKPTNGHTKFEKIEVKEIIQEAVKEVSLVANQKNILIAVKGEKAFLLGNKYSLQELFLILLDNAIKYSPEKRNIEIALKKENENVLITFKDHGIGIDKKDLPHIFDRFYRADLARSKKDSGGYGLGLSIAKKIIDNHNGAINVESELGKGTTFKILLPR